MRDIDHGAGVLDEKLFLSILKNGGFTIILDGFDELPDQRKKGIAIEINDLDLYGEDNSIVVTSRPNSIMPSLNNATIFDFVRLDLQQSQSLIRRIDSLLSLQTGELLIQKFDLVPKYFLEIPLLIVLLYKTFSYNQSIPHKIVAFYDETYNAFYKGHDLTKAGYVRAKVSGLNSIEFRKLLGALSLIMIVKEKNIMENRDDAYEIIESASLMTSINPKSSEMFFIDLLENVPFLIQDGGEFRFFHKSIIEFFAADYLCSGYKKLENLKKIVNSKLINIFNDVFEYIYEIDRNIYNEYILGGIAKEFIDMNLKGISDLLISMYIKNDVYVCMYELYDFYKDKPVFKIPEIIGRFARINKIVIDNYKVHQVNYGLRRFLFFIVIAQNTRFISERIIKKITKYMDFNLLNNNDKLMINPLNFDINRFIDILDDRAYEIRENSIVFNTLVKLYQKTLYLPNGSLPIIDIEKCQKILDDIEERKKSGALLDELLGL